MRNAKLEELIQFYMRHYFGWHGDTAWVDAVYEANDHDANGRVTGPGQWRALRRFAEQAHKILEDSTHE